MDKLGHRLPYYISILGSPRQLPYILKSYQVCSGHESRNEMSKYLAGRSYALVILAIPVRHPPCESKRRAC